MTELNSKLIDVYNMTGQVVLYVIEEDNVRRKFSAHETKKIDIDELRKLFYIDGGDVLLKEYLSVGDKELAREFGVPDDMIEYYWKKEDVDQLLESGSIDALQDAIEFGPKGICDLIKDRAVELNINDLAKRKVIDDMLNIDLGFMTAVYNEGQEDESPKQGGRRVNHQISEQETGRRVQ